MATPKYTQGNLDRLRSLITDADDVTARSYKPWVQRARIAIAAVYGEPSPALERFDRISYHLGFATDTTPQSAYDAATMRGVREAVGELSAIAEDIGLHLQEIEPPGPSVSGLHPWVADAASGLWNDGHRRQAVQSAASAVELRLKLKLDVHSGGAASIVASAFSPKPAEDLPRLRFADVGPEGSEQWNNAHEGAVAFGRGCFMRIRNLYTHNDGASEQEDLEALTALSLLARWIDSAEVLRPDA